MSSEVPSGPAVRRTKVLIADDSAAIRTSLSALISRLPHVEIVGLAQTGTEALRLTRSLQPDVITLDLRMPEMTGLSVLEAIKKDQLNPIIIVLTGLEEVEYRNKCMELGAKYFFHKATEFEKVIEILTQHNLPTPPPTSGASLADAP